MTRLVVVLLLLGVGMTPAQEPLTLEARRKAMLEGTHVFRRLLHDQGFTALEAMDDLRSEPDKTLVVVLGNVDVLADLPGGLERFLADGGSVLIASDRATLNADVRRAILRVAGVSIAADPVVCAWDCYSGRDFCPIVFAWRGSTPNLLDGVEERVATNVPSMLITRGLPRDIQPLLHLPNLSQIDAPSGRRPSFGPPLFGVGGPSGAGRIIVVADHSLFINEMMMPENTGNVEFSDNVIRYLADGTRSRVLFLEDGTIQTKLDLPLKSPRLSPSEMLALLYSRRNELLQEGEKWLAKQEDDDNALERKLMEAMEQRGLGFDRILYGALIVATLMGLFIAAYRLGLGDRYAPAQHTPLLDTLGRSLPNGPLAEQRLEALVGGRDVREPLGESARGWLADLGLRPGDPITVRGWWTGWSLRRRLQRVAKLASGRWPAPIPPARLDSWQRELDDLRAAHGRGQWRARDAA